MKIVSTIAVDEQQFGSIFPLNHYELNVKRDKKAKNVNGQMHKIWKTVYNWSNINYVVLKYWIIYSRLITVDN